MSKPISKPGAPRPPFRVIHGGLAAAHAGVAPAPESESFYIHSGKVTPGQLEEDRLAAAILRLVLPDLSITVLSCLDEMCDRIDSPEEGDIARYHLLRDAINVIGLRYVVARPEFELTRPGFLMLSWPDRLLRRHPELAAFRPEAHPCMPIG